MPTRRRFLQQSALVSLAPLVPGFLSLSARAAEVKPDERILVVIQLDGGNDGLNTVIPFADEEYARHRRELRIAPDKVLKLSDKIGLHPQMKGAAKLFEEGQLAVVQGVGYPNPNRSHFESMSIWHHARLNADDHDGIGWLGRAADAARRDATNSADAIYLGAETVPVALRGRRAQAVAFERESDLKLSADVSATPGASATKDDLNAFVERTVDQSFEAARKFGESSAASSGDGAKYPGSKLAQKLKLASRLIKLGGGTRIYFASQSGYDTHAAQLYPHSQLLDEFSSALRAFMQDLQASQLAERVLVMAFSEFGRRVEENGSAGTDHGCAGPMFLAGPSVRAGLIGDHPSLTDLDQGDLKMSTDFRQVYASLLQGWLGVAAPQVLGQEFSPLGCLKGSA